MTNNSPSHKETRRFMAGVLWVTLGNHAPFYLSLILTAVASLLLLFVRESRQS